MENSIFLTSDTNKNGLKWTYTLNYSHYPQKQSSIEGIYSKICFGNNDEKNEKMQ